MSTETEPVKIVPEITIEGLDALFQSAKYEMDAVTARSPEAAKFVIECLFAARKYIDTFGIDEIKEYHRGLKISEDLFILYVATDDQTNVQVVQVATSGSSLLRYLTATDIALQYGATNFAKFLWSALSALKDRYEAINKSDEKLSEYVKENIPEFITKRIAAAEAKAKII